MPSIESKQLNTQCSLYDCVMCIFLFLLTAFQQRSVNTVQFMTPVAQDVSKHATTGMRLAHATSPALQDATVQQI